MPRLYLMPRVCHSTEKHPKSSKWWKVGGTRKEGKGVVMRKGYKMEKADGDICSERKIPPMLRKQRGTTSRRNTLENNKITSAKSKSFQRNSE